MYLIIGKAIGQIKESNGNIYLVFDSTDENKEVLKKYKELWDGIKNEIETTNSGKAGECNKGFTKIKFDTDNLPLNTPLNRHMLKVIVRSVFEDEGKFYMQIYFDECLYES